MVQNLTPTLSRLFLLGFLIAFALGLEYLHAWTAPTQAPPNGNVAAPLNTGATLQGKSGGLTLGSTLDIGSSLTVGGVPGDGPYLIDMGGATPGATAGIRFPDDTVQTTAAGGSLGLSFDDFLHVQDQKPSGTSGGDMTFGSYNTRTLNTTLSNTITGASLSANTITLPTGTYYAEIHVPGQSLGVHKARLRNTTDSANTLIGTNAYGDYGTGDGMSHSIISGTFTISAQKNFQIQHRGTGSDTGHNFGRATSFGDTEIYTDVKIWKLN